MAAFIDDAMNIVHINTFVLYDSSENVASSEGPSQFLLWVLEYRSRVPIIRESHVQFW